LTAGRAGRALQSGLAGGYVATGVLATHRAYSPVAAVAIVVPEAPLTPTSELRVDTTTSERGPVVVRVECSQGARSELLAVDRVPAKPWA
jgi:N-methylhydantoinase A/oxoprolinase/acetone carboxylase beta subunit